MDCPDENSLLDFVQGRLAGEASNLIDRHLDSCESCQAMVGELGRTLSPASPSLAATVPGRTAAKEAPLAGGTQIGRYVLIDRIGAGGMGVVYAAHDPQLDRKVALKLLRDSVQASEERATRLMREAQVMARLSHPNVITVHDVGRYGDQLFVAMEHVEGTTLAAWLRRERRGWREVLEIFRLAGAGLAAAHRAGLVHRDFKPDNVLIDNDGRVRVSDFGLARAVGLADGAPPVPAAGQSPLTSPLTRTGALMGTPAYMAPEQFAGRPTDARTDQFSFCVALYEALYGERPFVAETFEALQAAVRDGVVRDPVRATSAPRSLRRIVLRGLSPSPDDRYATMDALLDAISRIVAPKRRLWALAAGAVALAVIAGAWAMRLRSAPDCAAAGRVLASAWNDEERESARRAFQSSGIAGAERTWAETDRTLDEWAKGWSAMRAEACVATWVHHVQSGELLDLRMQCLDSRRADFLALKVVLNGADETVVRNATKAAHALPAVSDCANAQALTARVKPPAQPEMRAKVDALRDRLSSARAQALAGKAADALKDEAPRVSEARGLGYRPLLADALVLRGDLERRLGDFKAAVTTLDEGSRVAESAGYDEAKAQALTLLVQVSGFELGHYKEGEQLAQHAQATLDRLGGNDVLQGQLLASLANVIYEQGRYSEAQKLHESALALRERVLGGQHPDVAYSLYALSKAVEAQGNITLALQYLDRALAIQTQVLGPDHPDVAVTLNAMGAFLDDGGRVNDALDRFQRALAINERAFGPDHPYGAKILTNLGSVYEKTDRFQEALDSYQRGHDIQVRYLGPDTNFTGDALVGMGSALTGLGRYSEARERIDAAMALYRKSVGEGHPEYGEALCKLGRLLLAQREYARAAAAFDQAERIYTQVEGGANPDVMMPMLGLGETELAQGRPAKALPILERAMALHQPKGDEPWTLPQVRFALARALWSTGKDRNRAVSLAHDAVSSLQTKGGSPRLIGEIQEWLARPGEPRGSR